MSAALLIACFAPPCCEQVRLELTEEYEQVKAIVATLESFKSEKPNDIVAPQSEEKPEDPAVWPPPIPAEHRCVCASGCWLPESQTAFMKLHKTFVTLCHIVFQQTSEFQVDQRKEPMKFFGVHTHTSPVVPYHAKAQMHLTPRPSATVHSHCPVPNNAGAPLRLTYIITPQHDFKFL